MKAIWISGLVLAVVMIAAIAYRACTPRPVQVEPHAAREIEKAKQR